MNVLVFEWFCGGGCWIDGFEIDPDSRMENLQGMLHQGMGMLTPLLDDLVLSGNSPTTFLDSRLIPLASKRMPRSVTIIPIDAANEVSSCLREQAQRCEGTILIAPETNGCLIEAIQWLGPWQDRLLSPGLDFVQLTSNKQATIEHLTAHGVPCPAGMLSIDMDFSNLHKLNGSVLRFPLVAKPIDGAGSQDVVLIETADDLKSIPHSDQIRIEEFEDGIPVSVSAICHRHDIELLPPTEQVFDNKPFGNYIGAKHPLSPSLEIRALKLARQAIGSLPMTRGYIGMDMILSHIGESRDFILEVNPRLTMSYGKLREICQFNIGERMLRT